MIRAGSVRRMDFAALKPERAPVLAGGLAIMLAALSELDVERINPVGGALRLGVLYDLLGRTSKRDVRVATVEQCLTRYRIDRAHAARVAAMAVDLFSKDRRHADPDSILRLRWAALLHESGFWVSTPATIGTAPTSSRTPTCLDSPRASRRGLRGSCWAAAAAWGRWQRPSRIPRFAGRWSPCGSRSSSTTRAARSTCRRLSSRSGRRSASTLRHAGRRRIR